MSTRRNLLASTVGAVVAGAALPLGAKATPPQPDADLLTACAAFNAIEAEVRRIDAKGSAHPDYDDGEMNIAIFAWYEALEVVHGIPSRTSAGLKAKAAIAHTILEHCLTDNNAPPDQDREEFFALSVLGEMAGKMV